MIKSLMTKVQKAKGNYLVANSNITADELDLIIEKEIFKRRQATKEECFKNRYVKELDIRKKKAEISLLEYKNSWFKLGENYQMAQGKSLKQHLEMLELKQILNVVKEI